MRKILMIGTVLSLFALPVTAAAQSGGAAGDEYTEQIPGGGGDRPSGEVGGGSSDPNSSGSVSPETVDALAEQGAAGERAAELAQATAPMQGSDEGQGATPASGTPAESSGGGVGGVINQIASGNDSDEGMGSALPIVLGVTVIGGLAFFLMRRRAASGPEQPA